MNKKKINKAQSRDRGISISGDNNTIEHHVYNGNMSINRTVLAELCEIIASSDTPQGKYSIKKNSDWIRKLEGNNVKRYTDIFENYCDAYDDIENILGDQYESREKMVRKINHVYTDLILQNPELDGKGDRILSEVFKKLKELVNESGTEAFEEEIDKSLIVMMFYVFTKCKLLEIRD